MTEIQDTAAKIKGQIGFYLLVALATAIIPILAAKGLGAVGAA